MHDCRPSTSSRPQVTRIFILVHLIPISYRYLFPLPGAHIFTYRRHLIWMSRNRTGNKAESSPVFETIRISTLGWSRVVLKALISDAHRRYIDRDTSRTIVFAADQYGTWCVGRDSGVPAYFRWGSGV